MIETESKLFEIILELEEENPEICSRTVRQKYNSVTDKNLTKSTIVTNLKRLERKGYLAENGKTVKWPSIKYETTEKGKLLHVMTMAGSKITGHQAEGIVDCIKSSEGSTYMQILKTIKDSEPISLAEIANLMGRATKQEITAQLDILRRVLFVKRTRKGNFYTYTLNEKVLTANSIYPER